MLVSQDDRLPQEHDAYQAREHPSTEAPAPMCRLTDDLQPRSGDKRVLYQVSSADFKNIRVLLLRHIHFSLKKCIYTCSTVFRSFACPEVGLSVAPNIMNLAVIPLSVISFFPSSPIFFSPLPLSVRARLLLLATSSSSLSTV